MLILRDFGIGFILIEFYGFLNILLFLVMKYDLNNKLVVMIMILMIVIMILMIWF